MLPASARPYDPVPPAAHTLDITKYPLKMATLSLDTTQSGWNQFKVQLSNEVRSKHLSDVVNAPKWRELILDFDKKSLDLTQHCV